MLQQSEKQPFNCFKMLSSRDFLGGKEIFLFFLCCSDIFVLLRYFCAVQIFLRRTSLIWFQWWFPQGIASTKKDEIGGKDNNRQQENMKHHKTYLFCSWKYSTWNNQSNMGLSNALPETLILQLHLEVPSTTCFSDDSRLSMCVSGFTLNTVLRSDKRAHIETRFICLHTIHPPHLYVCTSYICNGALQQRWLS